MYTCERKIFWWLFHTIYPLFCLHPKMTNVQDLALDNVLAIYPLVLLCVVYVLVELHNHGCRPILFLWRLFHVAFLISENSWTLEHHWLMPLPLCSVYQLTSLFPPLCTILMVKLFPICTFIMMEALNTLAGNIFHLESQHVWFF